MRLRRRWVRPVAFVLVDVFLIGLTVFVTLAIATPLDLTPNAAPWWGIPIFTLTGVLGGAVIAGTFTLKNEASKRQHELRMRHAKHQLDVAIKLATEVDQLYGASYYERTTKDDSAMIIAWRELQVVANKELVFAASLLMSAEYFFRQPAEEYDGSRDAADEFRRISNAYHYERIEFNNTMRRTEGQEPLPNAYGNPDDLPLIGGGIGMSPAGGIISVMPTPYLEWRSTQPSLGSPLALSEMQHLEPSPPRPKGPDSSPTSS